MLSLKKRRAYNTAATLVIADIAQARHDFRKALLLAENLKKEHPEEPAIYHILIKSQLALGELPLALNNAIILVHILPTPESYVLRALVYQALGNDKDTRSDFIQAFNTEEPGQLQNAIWSRNLFGRYLVSQGDYKTAEFLFNECLRLSTTEALTYGNLALLKESEENYTDAENYFKKAFFLVI